MIVTLAGVEVVLNNLKLIKKHKNEIMKVKPDKSIVIEGLKTNFNGNLFDVEYATCANADLYYLDRDVYDFGEIKKVISEKRNKNELKTILDFLAYDFSLKHKGTTYEDGYVSLMFPIPETMEEENGLRHKWLNETRWLYVDYLIERLTKMIETKNVYGE